jgi:hypothetical protein
LIHAMRMLIVNWSLKFYTMVANNRIASIVFSVYILVAFYVFGGGIVNSMVGYRTWNLVGENEFPQFHHADGSLIIPFFVVFFFFSFIPQILLFWYRPRVISASLVWAAFILNLIALVSTIAIQIPIQNELDKAFSAQLIEKLISTDMIYRRIPMLLMAIINFVMLYKVVSNANGRSSSVPDSIASA